MKEEFAEFSAEQDKNKILNEALPTRTGPNRRERRRKKALAKGKKGGRGFTKPLVKSKRKKR